LQLEPAVLRIPATQPAAPPQLSLSGLAAAEGYTLNLAGTATGQQVVDLSQLFPPLSDGVAAALPGAGALSQAPIPIDLTCSRQWPAVQTCTAALPAVVPHKRTSARHRP
jgi:hypothetical protein